MKCKNTKILRELPKTYGSNIRISKSKNQKFSMKYKITKNLKEMP
jgi:hypothetical protein